MMIRVAVAALAGAAVILVFVALAPQPALPADSPRTSDNGLPHPPALGLLRRSRGLGHAGSSLSCTLSKPLPLSFGCTR